MSLAKTKQNNKNQLKNKNNKSLKTKIEKRTSQFSKKKNCTDLFEFYRQSFQDYWHHLACKNTIIQTKAVPGRVMIFNRSGAMLCIVSRNNRPASWSCTTLPCSLFKKFNFDGEQKLNTLFMTNPTT